jgi:hypothetical protein
MKPIPSNIGSLASPYMDPSKKSYDFDGVTRKCIHHMPIKDTAKGSYNPEKGKGDPHLGPDLLMIMIPRELQVSGGKNRCPKTVFTNMRLYDLIPDPRGGEIIRHPGRPFHRRAPCSDGNGKTDCHGRSKDPGAGLVRFTAAFPQHRRPGDPHPCRVRRRHITTLSHHFKKSPSDQALNRILETALEERKTPFTKGPIWTTDAIYRETPEKVTAYQQQNILAVEMEVSALLAVASFRSVQMAALLVVSDELSQLEMGSRDFPTPAQKKKPRGRRTVAWIHKRLGRVRNIESGEIT